MERLNDITGRAVQRRQQSVGTDVSRLSNPTSHRPPPIETDVSHSSVEPMRTDVSRPSNPSNPVPRRPLPEQTARLGQKRQYGSQRHEQYPQPIQARTTQEQNESAVLREGQMYNYPPTNQAARPAHASYPRQRPPVNGVTSYQPDVQQVQEEVYPEYRQRRPVTNPLAPRTSQPYRTQQNDHTDDYAPTIAADVVDEWDDEDGGMVYGDWEKDEEEARIYRRTNQRTVREVAYPAELEGRVRVTRNLRMPVSAPTNSPAIPAPLPQPMPTRTQEVQHYQRTTRPLDPQAVASMGREISQEPQHIRRRPAQQPALNTPARIRQLVPQEQVQALSTGPMKQKSACPKCRGAGYLRADVPFGHPNFGKPITCECKEAEQREKRRQQLRTMSNLDGFRSNSFSTFNSRVPGVQEAFQDAKAYAQNPDGWLLLIGPNGCGKTHLAVAIANECLESGSVVLFAVVPDLLLHLRAAFAPNAAEVYDQLFYKMREAEVLVLDDLGTQQSSPWANETLFQLLNYRYNMGMPTVITANPKGFQGTDERIRSRLSDNSLVTHVTFERARDYRPNHPRRD